MLFRSRNPQVDINCFYACYLSRIPCELRDEVEKYRLPLQCEDAKKVMRCGKCTSFEPEMDTCVQTGITAMVYRWVLKKTEDDRQFKRAKDRLVISLTK